MFKKLRLKEDNMKIKTLQKTYFRKEENDWRGRSSWPTRRTWSSYPFKKI